MLCMYAALLLQHRRSASAAVWSCLASVAGEHMLHHLEIQQSQLADYMHTAVQDCCSTDVVQLLLSGHVLSVLVTCTFCCTFCHIS